MADSGFEREFLQTHNVYRAQHGAPPLTMSRALSRSAQVWAEHLLSIKTMKHSNGNHGENLYYAWSSAGKSLTGHEAVDSWYNEIKDYDFSKPGFSSKTGHFTQVVWKDSAELGVGLATDGQTTFVVGQYSPAGNMCNEGFFKRNVLPAGSTIDSKADRGGASLWVPHTQRTRSPSPSHKPAPKPAEGRGLQTGSSTNSGFEREFLQTHNVYRAQHGAPPLTMSRVLSCSAQVWAEHLLSIKTLKHSNGNHGENLYYAWSSARKSLTGHEAVDSWYDEIKDYDFSKPGFSSKTGHFTQVVWKDSAELGVGLATDGQTTFVVGQYSPAGNMCNEGFFKRNILPAGSSIDSKADRGGASLWVPHTQRTRSPSPSHKPAPKPAEGWGLQTGSSTSEDLVQFRRSLLEAQNRYRRQHGVGPLALDPALSREAQDWAAHLVSVRTLKNSGRGHGENMWSRCGSSTAAPTGSEVAESWYKESSKYNFSSPGFQRGTGNFSQMVWKSSERVGVGLATDGKGMFISVAFFEPAGNITNAGYFQDNVKGKGM